MCPALDHEVRPELLDEGNDQLGGVQAAFLHGNQSDRNQQAGKDLQAELGARRQTKIAALHHLYIVVSEADGREHAGRDDGEPHKYIRQIRPQQSGHHDGDRNQQTAHGGSAGLLLMGFGTFLPNVLPDLEVPQAIDHYWPNNKPGEERREARKRSTERKIAEDTKWRKIMVQLDEQQPIKQSASEFSRGSLFSRWSLVVGRWRIVVLRSPVVA